jgi:hypothetical protein
VKQETLIDVTKIFKASLEQQQISKFCNTHINTNTLQSRLKPVTCFMYYVAASPRLAIGQ